MVECFSDDFERATATYVFPVNAIGSYMQSVNGGLGPWGAPWQWDQSAFDGIDNTQGGDAGITNTGDGLGDGSGYVRQPPTANLPTTWIAALSDDDVPFIFLPAGFVVEATVGWDGTPEDFPCTITVGGRYGIGMQLNPAFLFGASITLGRATLFSESEPPIPGNRVSVATLFASPVNIKWEHNPAQNYSRAKVWHTADPEPDTWLLTTTGITIPHTPGFDARTMFAGGGYGTTGNPAAEFWATRIHGFEVCSMEGSAVNPPPGSHEETIYIDQYGPIGTGWGR